jgi:hypothetical protein
MIKKTAFYLIAGMFCACSLPALAQKKNTYSLPQWLSEKKLEAYNRTIRLSTDQKSVVTDQKEGEGLVWLKGVQFSSGVIEVDLRGKDVFQRSFLGIAFHGGNDSTYDAVYFRPFNFQATDPVRRIHAVQYISHPDHTWKRLREQHNGRYEKALQSLVNPDGWFHARIVVKQKRIEVFVNDDKVPSLAVDKLNDRTEGKLGLWVGDGSDGEFGNLSIYPGKQN